jgi:hypothetical protein
LRNAADYSCFINDFWTHPETLRIVSDAAGLPLSIIMRTEIGHTNIQGQGSTISEMLAELSVEPDLTKVELTEEEKAYDPLKSSIIPWQYVLALFIKLNALLTWVAMTLSHTYAF